MCVFSFLSNCLQAMNIRCVFFVKIQIIVPPFSHNYQILSELNGCNIVSAHRKQLTFEEVFLARSVFAAKEEAIHELSEVHDSHKFRYNILALSKPKRLLEGAAIERRSRRIPVRGLNILDNIKSTSTDVREYFFKREHLISGIMTSVVNHYIDRRRYFVQH